MKKRLERGQILENVFDVDEAKWGHPKAREKWDNKMKDGERMYDPTQSIEDKRAWAAQQQAMMDSFGSPVPEDSPCELMTYEVPGCLEEPETKAIVNVVVPKKLKNRKNKGVLFLIAGGGMTTVDALRGHMKPITYYAELCKCIVVSTKYRTNLEAEYPAAMNDLHAAYQWILDNAEELGVNTDKIVLSGVSAGAALALSLPFRLMRYGITNVRGILAEEPITDDREVYPSSQIIGTPWNGVDHHGAYRGYLGLNHGSGRIGAEALANRATVEDCIGYPPTFIHSCEYDPDSDYNREFYGKIKAARSFAEYHCWGGLGHAGFFLAPELATNYNIIVQDNMVTLFEQDLRRPWVVEEYKEKVMTKLDKFR